jgi:hypothetical protein
MKIGMFATFMSPLATPGMIRHFGRRSEDVGLDSIWMGEHVTLFDKNTFSYPGSKDGRIPSRSCRSATRSAPQGGVCTSSGTSFLPSCWRMHLSRSRTARKMFRSIRCSIAF